ncbi:MAG TPA: hypothetical protein VK470_15250 [Bacteroidota bacterium]|nr:hypothetical protein [Bacteroidota bacterium]
MTHVEQHNTILALRDHESRMTREEQTRFTGYVKRDKDDEELDEHSRTDLESLHAKYCPAHTKESIEDKWKKLFK